jgi:hypothetical protein
VLENRWNIVANYHLPLGAIFVVSGAFVGFDSSGWFESHLARCCKSAIIIHHKIQRNLAVDRVLMATRGHGISNVAPAAEVKFMHQLVSADQYWKKWQAELFLNLSIFDDVPSSVCHRTMCNLGLTNVLSSFLVIQGAACSRMH